MGFVSDFEDAFLIELNNAFPITIILDYQGGREQTREYGVIGITTFNKLHRDKNHFNKTVDGFEEKLNQDYNILLTVSFYGPNAYDNAFEAQALFSYEDVIEGFYETNNISIVDITQVRRMTDLRDTGYIQRATFDIETLTAFESTLDIDWFDSVRWKGRFEDIDGSTV